MPKSDPAPGGNEQPAACSSKLPFEPSGPQSFEYRKKDAKTSKWVGIFLLIAGFLALIAPLGTGLSLTFTILVPFSELDAKLLRELEEEHGAPAEMIMKCLKSSCQCTD